MVELSVLKGTKDRLPSEQVLREQIITKIKKVFQLYGFQPATTPIIEIWEVLASKYAGGEEILKETYKLKDQGKRELGLRYDLSVPLARLIGMNPQLSKPFKRYEIGSCFRDGPIKKGRYREFVQCDADTIGVSSMLADAECLAMAHQIFNSLGIDVYLEVKKEQIIHEFNFPLAPVVINSKKHNRFFFKFHLNFTIQTSYFFLPKTFF